MAQVFISPKAKEDLAALWDFIAEDSVARADKFIDLLDRKLRALASRPMMGRDRGLLGDGLRSFPVGNYILYYTAHKDGILVVRVLHGVRDHDVLFLTK